MAYTESNDPVVTARAVADLQRLQAAGINNTDEGVNVYDAIANDPNLTGRQKQAVCCELGKAIVAQGITDAGAHPTTLLRQSSASTRFMSAYMEDSASRFFNAVKEKAADVGRQNVQTPPANPGDAVSYDDAAAPGATRALLTALDTEKHKLSADACEFMQACSAGIPEHIVDGERQDVENTLAVNTLLQTEEAIGRLRGRVHRLGSVPVIVTYHPAYLLRNLPEKAKAWADLCLAMDVAERGA